MNSITGKISFMLDNVHIEANYTDLIHFDESINNELPDVNKIITENNVYIVIETELKDRKLSGSLHDIKVFDKQGKLIAYCNNPKEDNKLVFITTKLKV